MVDNQATQAKHNAQTHGDDCYGALARQRWPGLLHSSIIVEVRPGQVRSFGCGVVMGVPVPLLMM